MMANQRTIMLTKYRIGHSCASQVPTISPILRYIVNGALIQHRGWMTSVMRVP